MSQLTIDVVGFKEQDDEWRRMKVVWDACVDAECDVPDQVLEYFNNEEPDDKPGPEVNLTNLGHGVEDYISSVLGESGYDITLRDLPPEVVIVRVLWKSA